MHVILTLIKGPDTGKKFEFNEANTFLVGRSDKAHLKLNTDSSDKNISNVHCVLDIRPPQCVITDLDSKNGTYVNCDKISQVFLNDNDVIKIGNTEILINIEDEKNRQEFAVSEKYYKSSKTQPKDLIQDLSLQFNCYACGKDLKDVADSDGRAIEFSDTLYLCENCFVKEEEFGLDFTNINDYSLLAKLGKGIMGVVYKAVHNSTRRVFALKRIESEYVRDEIACNMFENEIRIQSRLFHPNLLKVFDTGHAGITPFFITEFMPGKNVENLVSNICKGPVEAEIACKITIQILKGLKVLHENGYVHRDLKPSNFLLSTPDIKDLKQDFNVKICGYGLAKSFEDAGNSLFDFTKNNKLQGYMFMPPEQLLDYQNVKPQADLYSVGVSLYYMLSAKYTVDFPTPLDLLMRAIAKKKPKNPVEIIVEDLPIPILKRNPDVYKNLAKIVDKAVSKEVLQRFQTADEFILALENL